MGIAYVPTELDAIRTDSMEHIKNDSVNYVANKATKLAESLSTEFGVIKSAALEITTDFAKNLAAMREQGVSLAKGSAVEEKNTTSIGMN